MFVSVTTIKIPDKAMIPRMEESFKKNVPNLKKIDGFMHFELWKQEKEVKSVSYWDSKEAFERYINSEMFKQHHGGSGHHGDAQVEQYESVTFGE